MIAGLPNGTTVLVTGGAGFIGSAVVRALMARTEARVVNVDKLTYAASRASVASVADHPRYFFEQADIADDGVMDALVAAYRPEAIVHLAAETHVDRSIDDPDAFLRSNTVGTHRLLNAALAYWSRLSGEARHRFRFHHVSTDEVFGSLAADDPPFDESAPYAPRSPYAATKAAADHFVRAWWHTYGLPVLITSCSNNYGPYQFPEKLIPLTILRALAGRDLPLYGRGDNIRDWLHVEDHAEAILTVLAKGVPGRTYCIGGRAERTNLQVVEAICDLVDAKAAPLPDGAPRRRLITPVADRPGHDFRYATDCTLIETSLGWRPMRSFETGLAETVDWFLDRSDWWKPLADRFGLERLGLSASANAIGP